MLPPEVVSPVAQIVNFQPVYLVFLTNVDNVPLFHNLELTKYQKPFQVCIPKFVIFCFLKNTDLLWTKNP